MAKKEGIVVSLKASPGKGKGWLETFKTRADKAAVAMRFCQQSEGARMILRE